MRRSNPRSWKEWTSAAARRLLSMAGNPPAIDDAVDIVARRFLDIDAQVPTPLEAVAGRVNVAGFEPETVPYSGELRRVGSEFRVIYSKDLSPVRRRFTIAHELAHAIFELSGPNAPRVGQELERLCDMLAVELLMPRRLFWPELVKGGLSCDTVLALAQRFQTSVATTGRRCAELLGAKSRAPAELFGVEGEYVTWGSGPAIRRGPLAAVKDRTLRDFIRSGVAAGGVSTIWLSETTPIGDWQIEAKSLGQGDSAIFTLYPARWKNELASEGLAKLPPF